MRVVAVIPARMGSSRFPGKPLAYILGLPMIEHVRRRVALSPSIDEVVVATCDQEIADVVTHYGGRAIMTANTYERCTDRVAEAALPLVADVVVNVQGDEPLVMPEMLEALLLPLRNESNLLCTNLVADITNDDEFNTTNEVKVVGDLEDNILYLSREPIPSVRKANSGTFKKYKQLGIIAFRKSFLHQFTKLPPTPLEAIESVDMLRAIEHGFKIRMVFSKFKCVGVDTPEELEYAITLMKNDKILASYLNVP